MAGLLDEIPQHGLGDIEVGDYAVFHRPDGGDISGGATQHSLGLGSDGADFAGDGVERDDRGLAQNDSLVLNVNQRVGGAQIDSDVVGKITEEINHDCLTRAGDGAHAVGSKSSLGASVNAGIGPTPRALPQAEG